MNLRRFIKFFAIAVGFQLFLLFGGYIILFGPSGEGNFRESLWLGVYGPFIEGVIKAGAYQGESSMIWPPVYGTLLGVLVYSTIFSLGFSFLLHVVKRRSPTR